MIHVHIFRYVQRSQRTELLNVLCRGYHASGPFYENEPSGSEEPEPKRKLSGFNKPTHISVELASFLGQDPNVQVARASVTQALSAYVNAHTLKDPSDGRIIRADHKLSKLLNLRSGDTLTFFNLQRYLKPHFIKASELNSPAGHEIEDVASNRTAVLNPVYDPTPDSPIASLSKAPESASAASPPRMPRIVAIPASDVAAAIDRNPYRASSDLRTDLKRRYISSVLNGSNKLEQKVQFTSTHTSHVSELDAVQVIPQRAEPRQQLQVRYCIFLLHICCFVLSICSIS